MTETIFDLIADLTVYLKAMNMPIGHEAHEIRLYAVSPIATRSLQYANICGEW